MYMVKINQARGNYSVLLRVWGMSTGIHKRVQIHLTRVHINIDKYDQLTYSTCNTLNTYTMHIHNEARIYNHVIQVIIST